MSRAVGQVGQFNDLQRFYFLTSVIFNDIVSAEGANYYTYAHRSEEKESSNRLPQDRS